MSGVFGHLVSSTFHEGGSEHSIFHCICTCMYYCISKIVDKLFFDFGIGIVKMK